VLPTPYPTRQNVTKTQSRASVRERKFAALDTFVKAEFAQTKAVNVEKTARLKALRLARDVENAKPAASADSKPASSSDGYGPRNTMHLRRFSQ